MTNLNITHADKIKIQYSSYINRLQALYALNDDYCLFQTSVRQLEKEIKEFEEKNKIYLD